MKLPSCYQARTVSVQLTIAVESIAQFAQTVEINHSEVAHLRRQFRLITVRLRSCYQARTVTIAVESIAQFAQTVEINHSEVAHLRRQLK